MNLCGPGSAGSGVLCGLRPQKKPTKRTLGSSGKQSKGRCEKRFLSPLRLKGTFKSFCQCVSLIEKKPEPGQRSTAIDVPSRRSRIDDPLQKPASAVIA